MIYCTDFSTINGTDEFGNTMGIIGNAKVICTTGNYFYVVSAKGTQSGMGYFAANFANIIYEKLGGASTPVPEIQDMQAATSLAPTLQEPEQHLRWCTPCL